MMFFLKVKNISSKRVIPIHPKLLEFDFMVWENHF